MAACERLAVLCLVVSLSLAASVRDDVAPDVGAAELDALGSKIRSLESAIEEKSKELTSKEVILAQKEIANKEKADKVDSLQGELLSFQKKRKLDAAAQVGKAYAHTEELEKQVEKLNGEIASQNKQKEALESRISESEKKISVLVLKHDNATEKKAQTEEWAAPHMEKIKTEYIPAVREQSLAIKASLESHVHSLTVKAVEHTVSVEGIYSSRQIAVIGNQSVS